MSGARIYEVNGRRVTPEVFARHASEVVFDLQKRLAKAEQQQRDLAAKVEVLAEEWERLPQPPDEDYEGTTEGHWAFGEWLAMRDAAKRLRNILDDVQTLEDK